MELKGSYALLHWRYTTVSSMHILVWELQDNELHSCMELQDMELHKFVWDLQEIHTLVRGPGSYTLHCL